MLITINAAFKSKHYSRCNVNIEINDSELKNLSEDEREQYIFTKALEAVVGEIEIEYETESAEESISV